MSYAFCKDSGSRAGTLRRNRRPPDALPHSQPCDGLSGLRPRTVAPLLQRSWASSRIDWDRGSAAKVLTSRDAHDADRFACQAGCSRCARRLPWTTAGGRRRAEREGRAQDLRRHCRGRLCRLSRHGEEPPARRQPASRQPDRSKHARRPRRLGRGAHPLHADRGLPLRQQDRRRLGGQGEFLAARRGPDRLRRQAPTAPTLPRTSFTPPTSSPTPR